MNKRFIFSSLDTFASVLPVRLSQTSGHVWFLLAEHGFASTCLSPSCSSFKAVCLLFSFSWTCGSLISVIFKFLQPVFQHLLFLLQIIQKGQRNWELNLSSAWMHRSHLKFCGLGKFTWQLCPIILPLAIWTITASRMVRPVVSNRTSLSLWQFTEAALQAKQVYGLQGHPGWRPCCQLLSHCRMWYPDFQTRNSPPLRITKYSAVYHGHSSSGQGSASACKVFWYVLTIPPFWVCPFDWKIIVI